MFPILPPNCWLLVCGFLFTDSNKEIVNADRDGSTRWGQRSIRPSGIWRQSGVWRPSGAWRQGENQTWLLLWVPAWHQYTSIWTPSQMLGVFSLLSRKRYLILINGPDGLIQDPNGQLFLAYFSASPFNMKIWILDLKRMGSVILLCLIGCDVYQFNVIIFSKCKVYNFAVLCITSHPYSALECKVYYLL